MDFLILVDLHHPCASAAHTSACMGQESRKNNSGLLTKCGRVDWFPDSVSGRRHCMKILRSACFDGGNTTFSPDHSSVQDHHAEFFLMLIFFCHRLARRNGLGSTGVGQECLGARFLSPSKVP